MQKGVSGIKHFIGSNFDIEIKIDLAVIVVIDQFGQTSDQDLYCTDVS